MKIQELYHGANGDKILGIVRTGSMVPQDDKIFFSKWQPETLFQHGGDISRKAAFVIRVRVSIPDSLDLRQVTTPGVPDTWILDTSEPVAVKVLELQIRRRPGEKPEVVKGADEIKKALTG